MDTIDHAIGLCLGASTLSMVRVALEPSADPHRPAAMAVKVRDHRVRLHDGNPKQVLIETLQEISRHPSTKVALTGRKFRHLINLSSISEPEAVESAFNFVKPKHDPCPVLISAGGETFMVYVMDAKGRITNVISGNKCAAGTGEFFLQQLRRMDVTLEQAAQWTDETKPYLVSGRCSVFCKSDCTHATNKGIPKSRVTAGLGKMMADKIIGLLNKVECSTVMLVGGTARNQMMVHHLRQVIQNLIIPDQAPYFEALGAALWALENDTQSLPDPSRLFISQQHGFDRLSALTAFHSLVSYRTGTRDRIRAGDVCLLGLDVGSTTTKAVLIRHTDDIPLATVYLRTNGDPVAAARKCYSAILAEIGQHVDPQTITIIGLGVCGSGRQIASLHAQTDGIINEIIAHATAALYFDPEVDTIIEIGGQDAKYTHIVNGVPADYAMNEACSAGTGSFLEESALETLGLPMEKIAGVALQATQPPNFNDQCAAFIASDIKNAIHDGIAQQDIVAGLVYSICMNYNNRVKGNRPVGDKIFMQGGVCYNTAVPLAMAALVGKPIVVPPQPGLMGAFGAALEVKKRLSNGQLHPTHHDLAELADRTVVYKQPFRCKGGKEPCDRRCEISRIRVNQRTYPFGGACNRYENMRRSRHIDSGDLNLVRIRQQLIFQKYAPAPWDRDSVKYRGRIGLNRSFLVHTYYPLYAHFFSALGFEPLLPENPDPMGIDQCNAPFCFPAELAHGFFHDLITTRRPLDYLFLPHLKSMPSLEKNPNTQLCPLVQGEPFFLQTTFRKQLRRLAQTGTQILTPLLDLGRGLTQAKNPMVATAMQMGIPRKAAEKAFARALGIMQDCLTEMQKIGHQALARLEHNRDQLGIVLFARPYNGYAPEAHMGIPRKFASRGVMVIPLDFLDLAGQASKRFMYWGMGQRIMMAGRKVKPHPQLFGTYITNFSCGPDSFIVGYLRNLMGTKPTLTLELDSHTADAGLETRIDAFLDIVRAYQQLPANEKSLPVQANTFRPARVTHVNGTPALTTGNGFTLALTDPRVTLLLPSMGKLGTQALAAAFRSAGFNALPHAPSNETILKTGRGNTTCKECLPLILTTGTLIDYLEHHKQPDEVVAYFMPNGSGPCRFGQYHIFMEDLIRKRQIPDVAILSLSSDLGYGGLGANIHRRGWWAVVVSDVFEDMRAMLLANARHRPSAMARFDRTFSGVLKALETGKFRSLEQALLKAARQINDIPLQQPPTQVPRILLTGEIFVRRDSLSRQHLTEQLAKKGFATICTPVAEWILYSDYIVHNGLSPQGQLGVRGKMGARLKRYLMHKDEQCIKKILSASGLVHPAPIRIAPIIDTAKPYISPHLGGEAILTVGSAIKEVATTTCGVIAIGPFGCMPNRLSEAILKETMKREDKLISDPQNRMLPTVVNEMEALPFLAIESDGSPFPQVQHARLEAFCLQANRLHQRMLHAQYAN